MADRDQLGQPLRVVLAVLGKKSFAPLLNVLVTFDICLTVRSAIEGKDERQGGDAGGEGLAAAVRAGARRGRGTRRNLKAKFTCFSPVLSGSWIGAPQPQREIGSN
jgi:hypothetical protein